MYLSIIRAGMNLLIGPANSGKTEHLLSRLHEAIESGRGSVHLIAPSSRSSGILFDRLQSVTGSRDGRKLGQVITSFPKLYVTLLGHVRKSVNWITPGGRDRMIGRITMRLADEGRLEYFAGTADCPGLATAISRFIDELWRAGIGPDEFAAAVETRSAKDRDLALVFTHYREALSFAGLIDPEGAGLAAVKLLEGKTATGLLVSDEARASVARSYSMIAADDFDFYSPVQVRLLSLLAAHGVETAATLTYEEGRSIHLWQEPTRRRFEKAGFDIIRFSSKPATAIQLAAARLLCDDSEEAEAVSVGDGAEPGAASEITILSAPDRASEVRAVAREVKKLVINHGVMPGEIAVVCRSLAVYSPYLERIFDECRIPLRIDCPQALANNQLALSIMKLLDLHAGDFPRRAVGDLLRSPYLDLTGFRLGPSDVELIDAISLDGNVTRGRDLWRGALASAPAARRERTAEADIAWDPEETNPNRAARFSLIASALSDFFHAITPPATGRRREMADFISNLLDVLKVKEGVETSPFAERDRRALESFESILIDLSREHADHGPEGSSRGAQRAEVSWPQFYGELERAFNASAFERPPVSGPSVVAQEAHNLCPRSYRAIFVLGLVEGEFPAKSSERAPYTRNERAELREAGIDLTESTMDAGADLLQFYKAMSRCRERLFLTYARTDSTGGEFLKSYLIDEIISAAPVRETRINQFPQDADEEKQAGAASLDELALISARALRAGVASGRAEPGLGAHEHLSRNLPEWNAALRGAAIEADRIFYRGSAAHRGFISDNSLGPFLKRKLGKNHLWSATQINDYGVCPYRFFAGHLLRLAPVNEPVEGFVSNRLGSAYHKILERFYSERNTAGEDIEPGSIEKIEKHEAMAGRISDEVIECMIEAGEVRASPFLEFEKGSIKRQVVKLIQAEEKWRESIPSRPSAFELDFGQKGTPPLIIQSDDEEIRVCGTIDRIDEASEGVIVIDYKTRRTPVPYDDALDGRDLQLPIYILAISRVLRPGEEVSSAYYLHINSRKKGSEFPGKKDERLSLKSIMEHAEDRVREYASRARGGNFPVRPNNNTCAPYCGYQLMCRIQSIGSDRDQRE